MRTAPFEERIEHGPTAPELIATLRERLGQVQEGDIFVVAPLAGNTALFIFPLCVLFVFLVHSAEYESWSLPLAIILIAPMCLPFALLGI